MCNCNNTCSTCDNEKTCRLSVTVEDSFAPCTFRKKYFDVEIRGKDGSAVVSGRVEAGGSEVFDLPCSCGGSGEYNVTVTGDVYSSPRSQTRRATCCCGSTGGVTFIFLSYEPDCEPKFCPPVICPPPCPPPCPPKDCCPNACPEPSCGEQAAVRISVPTIEILK